MVAKTAASATSSSAVREKREEIGSWVRESDEKLLRERLLYGRRGGGGAAVGGGGEAEKERYTWGDEYRPKWLEEFICNRKTACELKDVVKERGCGHYIFEGAPGVGKRTMIQAMLREAFGEAAMEVYCQYDLINLPFPPHISFFLFVSSSYPSYNAIHSSCPKIIE